MKTLFDKETRDEITKRPDRVEGNTKAQWGRMALKTVGPLYFELFKAVR